MIDRQHDLPITKQAKALGISRGRHPGPRRRPRRGSRSSRLFFIWLHHVFADGGYAGDKLKDTLCRIEITRLLQEFNPRSRNLVRVRLARKYLGSNCAGQGFYDIRSSGQIIQLLCGSRNGPRDCDQARRAP